MSSLSEASGHRWGPKTGLLIWWILLGVCAAYRPLQLDEVLQLIGTRTEHLAGVFGWLRINPGSVPLGYVAQWALLQATGFSSFMARVPSLVSWILTAAVCMRIGMRAGLRRPESLLLMTALTPLLFRYAIEGRPYLPAFCLTACSTLLMLEFISGPEERPATWRLGIYGASLGIAPLIQGTAATVTLAHAVFVLTENSLRRDRKRQIPFVVAIVLSLLLPVAWSLAMRNAWADSITRAGYTFAFSARSLYGFLKDLSGGGLVCTGLLTAAAVFACVRSKMLRPVKYLLGLTAATAIAGALGSDALAGYFTSPRQAIYCLCPLLVLAAAGWEETRRKYRMPAIAALGLFTVAALAKDVSIVRSKENWQAASALVTKSVDEGFCTQPASDLNTSLGLYSFFDPSIGMHKCGASDAKIALIHNTFTTPAETDGAVTALVKRGFVAAGSAQAGGTTVVHFILRTAAH